MAALVPQDWSATPSSSMMHISGQQVQMAELTGAAERYVLGFSKQVTKIKASEPN